MPRNTAAQNPFPGPVNTDGFQIIASSCSVTDQVHLATGNFSSLVTLVDVPTIGLPLRFYLTYNALETVLGPVGHKWCHNYMTRLVVNDPESPTYVSLLTESGRQYGFIFSNGAYHLDNDLSSGSGYYFYPATLSHIGSEWRISFPDGSFHLFDSDGLLIGSANAHEDTTTLAYTNGNLTTITEPCGRQITLGYNQDGLLDSITDPNGNETQLIYDSSQNLTQVVAPAGCTTTYGYPTPSDHRIGSRTDSKNQTYTFSYNGSGQLVSVTDPESPAHTIYYVYDTISEDPGAGLPNMTLARTRLTDANENVWVYHFDQSNMLWRVIDPLGHWRHYCWDNNQKLIHESGPFTNDGIAAGEENPNDIFRRAVTDASGNLVQTVDATGIVTPYAYDSQNRMTAVYPGQAELFTQGSWMGQYGSEGYLLCGFDSDSADLQSLPSYVSSITRASSTRVHYGDASGNVMRLMDPRAPVSPTSLRRGLGAWVFTGTSPQVTISLEEARSFNLGFYTHSAENAIVVSSPMQYWELFGRDLTITVSDLDGTQTFRVYNNAGGMWVTFPVRGDASHPIQVTVVESGNNTTDARISALTFDPFDSKRTLLSYDPRNGDLLGVTDSLGQQTRMTYHPDGTLATLRDALDRQSAFFYEDTARNLTRMVDAAAQSTRMTYDANGNVLTTTDANGHTTRMAYDEKNRLTEIVDPLGHTTTLEYDPNGLLWRLTDANGQVSVYLYTPTNRLRSITDPLDQETVFTYDGSGNLLTVTDAKSHVTEFQYDAAERIIQVTRPDSTLVTLAFNGLDRLVAATGPNGNQAELSSINVTNAANWVRNPGAEDANPNTPTSPRDWLLQGGGGWDSTHSHTKQMSLRLALSSGTQYWSQSQIGLPPGMTALVQMWVRPDGSESSSTVWNGVRMRGFDGQLHEVSSTPTALPSSSTDWLQTEPFRVQVPGDAQFTRATVGELRAYGSSESTADAWVDDLSLYAVGSAVGYDGEGRFKQAMGPDGALSSVQRDRYGRVVMATDPRGRVVRVVYDSLDRVTQVADPLGNVVTYAYDAVGNLVSFQDPSGNVTQYAYDDLDRLTTITYPDESTEQFTYDAVSNLASYTNNRSQVRTFTYDAAGRLVRISYATDSTRIKLAYDAVGNLRSRVERSGERTVFDYDALYRVVQVFRRRTGEQPWVQVHTYDANGNRVGFNSVVTGPVYDTAQYDMATEAEPGVSWSVPAPGLDSMDRMPSYSDASSNTTSFTYDVEGRRTGITHPNGSPPVVTQATYDVVGRLMSLTTTQGSTTLMTLRYGYDLASNRTWMGAGDDTFDYRMDDSGQLVEEAMNRMVERSAERFAMGSFQQVTADADGVSLLPFDDSFEGTVFNADRWRLAYVGDFIGFEVRQDEGLELVFPRGFSNLTRGALPPVYDPYGLNPTGLLVAAEHRTPLSGDFDIQVDFAEFQVYNGCRPAALQVMQAPVQSLTSTDRAVIGIKAGCYEVDVNVDSQSVLYDNTISFTGTSGKLRIARSGSTVTLSYWNGSAWVAAGSTSGFITDDVYAALVFQADASSLGACAYRNFARTSPETSHPTTGTYTSTVYDACRQVTWGQLHWTATTPGSTTVEFQVAVADSPSGPWAFVGPDGLSTSFFQTSGTSMSQVPAGRYLRYQATFSGDGTVTPVLSGVEVSFSGTNGSSLKLFIYDATGNMTRTTTVTDTGTSTEVRDDATWSAGDRVNNLNQIQRNDVTPAGESTVTWRYTYDLSGNLTSKSNGTDTWTYTWDEDNRLLQVGLPGGATVGYTYDMSGRMLTRTDSATSTVTRFEWDGMDIIRETISSISPTRYGTARFGTSHYSANYSVLSSTRYYVINGELLSFERDSVTYQIHADALASVRMVTGPDGTVVARFDYDAWGNKLDSSYDNVPGGLSALYVGALGVRWEATTGLYYMRQRWYDPGLGRFVSRDPIPDANLYYYVHNMPNGHTDPTGLQGGPDSRAMQQAEFDRQRRECGKPARTVSPYLCFVTCILPASLADDVIAIVGFSGAEATAKRKGWNFLRIGAGVAKKGTIVLAAVFGSGPAIRLCAEMCGVTLGAWTQRTPDRWVQFRMEGNDLIIRIDDPDNMNKPPRYPMKHWN